MLLTNALNPNGSVADRFEEIPDEIKFKNTVTALKRLISIMPDDITLVLEPLNTLVDHAGYYLADIDVASAIIREVGSARLKGPWHKGLYNCRTPCQRDPSALPPFSEIHFGRCSNSLLTDKRSRLRE